MPTPETIAQTLAAAFLAGPLDEDGLVARGAQSFGRRWRWLRPLARRVCDTFAGGQRPRLNDLAGWLLADDGFRRAYERHDLAVATILHAPPTMVPLAAAKAWTIPAIRTPVELADWLGLSIEELDWFADLRRMEYKVASGRLRHYHYRLLAKRFGQIRLIEAPKPRLKALQRRILSEILDRVPPHNAAHGFRAGRSIRTFAAEHVGKRVVLRIDLKDFFPSIRAAQVQALFGAIGYPESVAQLLTGLCTNSAPQDIWEDDAVPARGWPMLNAERLYAQPHLPQGAPTSPALANLCAYRLDCRLAGLAHAAGAAYTRYADDLAFSASGDFERGAKRFGLHIAAIALEEGFHVHHRKTRVMRCGVRQHLAGIVVNERPNIRRADYDRLKATLTNCLRHGPQSQNQQRHADFRAHLLGRISFVEMINIERGRRLRELFSRIAW